MGDITFKFLYKKWEIYNRNRIQYFLFKKQPKAWQYRNMLTLMFPRKVGNGYFNPVVSDEIFFRERRGFFENRFEVGGLFILSSWGGAGLSYILRTQENTEREWKNFYIFRFRADFAF